MDGKHGDYWMDIASSLSRKVASLSLDTTLQIIGPTARLIQLGFFHDFFSLFFNKIKTSFRAAKINMAGPIIIVIRPTALLTHC